MCIIFVGMKKEKQELALVIMGNGKYRMNMESGRLESYYKALGVWEVVKGNLLPSVYRQHIIYLGRGTKARCVVYEHHLMWLVCCGAFKEGLVIHHKDTDRSNNRLSNLDVVSQCKNVEHARRERERVKSGISRLIRETEIASIKFYLRAGEKNQSKIARELNLNRLSVRYTIKKIEAGAALKYENGSPKSPNNKIEKWQKDNHNLESF